MKSTALRWSALALSAGLLGCYGDLPAQADAGADKDAALIDDVKPPLDAPSMDADLDASVDAPLDVVPVDTGCSGDDACPASQHCDAVSRACEAGCHADEGCAVATADGGVGPMRCDPVAHACVRCLASDDCPLGHVCTDRACVPGCTAARGCPTGAACCGSACVDLQASLSHCGACGAGCVVAHGTAACVAGACGVAGCADGFGDCDRMPANGCETDTGSAMLHCGGCGLACAPAGATGACTAGRCVLVGCDAGRGDCDGVAANGCEADTTGSTSSCGACGHACATGERCAAGACQTMRTCREIHVALPTLPNGAYPIDPDGPGGRAPFTAYCDMTSDGGGWTLALKADGAQTTFAYDSALWGNADTLNPASTTLDPVEAKFDAFALVPFTALRLAFVDGGTSRALVIPFRATASLLAVFGPGEFVATEVSRSGWVGLMASPSLQPHCNREGLNNNVPGYTRVRLGIVANQEDDCASPDSRIGIGGQGNACAPSLGNNTVGNSASCSSDNGDRDTRAFGYLFVR